MSLTGAHIDRQHVPTPIAAQCNSTRQHSLRGNKRQAYPLVVKSGAVEWHTQTHSLVHQYQSQKTGKDPIAVLKPK